MRTALTVVGISLGVATVLGMANVSRTILASFDHMVSTVAGASELEITSAAGDVDAALVERAKASVGVRDAAGLIESFVALADRPHESLYVLGLDFLGSPVWREQIPSEAIDIEDELVFVARPDSVMLTQSFMRRAGLVAGDTVRVLAPAGVRTLRVRGTLRDAPIAALFDSMVAVMDLLSAQRLLGREHRVDRIAIAVAPGARIADVRGRLAAALGPAVDVAASEARGRECERLLFSLRSMLVCASSLAVIVGAFIVYQTVAVSVQQRRRQFALLNTVGVQRRSLMRLCLAETVLLAVGGGAVGLLLGELLSRLASGVVGNAASEIWVQLSVAPTAHSPWAMVTGGLVAGSTALLAAYLAIRATFRAPTVEALRPGTIEIERLGGRLRLLLFGVAVVGSSWLIAFVPPGTAFGPLVALVIATHVLAYGGAALIAPPLVQWLGAATRSFARRSRSLPIRLAADSLPRSPWRAGTTVATIVAALGMAVTLASVVHSFEAAWLHWVEQHFGADLFVGAGSRFRLLAGQPLDEEVGERIARALGVADVEPFRVVRMRLGDQPVFLQGVSLEERLRHGGLPMVEGDLGAAAPALRAGTGVLVSDNLAVRLGLRPGAAIALPTPSGPRAFRIEGTFVDYLGSLDLGAVAVARTQLEAVWGDRRANLFRVWLAPGARASEVRSAILAQLGGAGYYVVTAAQFLESVRSVLGRFFLATWALQLVAAIVGVIGVVNAQLAAVLDRTGEIRTMRTVGVSARHVVRALVLECAALGALGGLGGVVIGGMLGAQFIHVSLALITGWRMPFAAPSAPIVTTLVLAVVMSAVAGYLPARAAARLTMRHQSLD